MYAVGLAMGGYAFLFYLLLLFVQKRGGPSFLKIFTALAILVSVGSAAAITVTAFREQIPHYLGYAAVAMVIASLNICIIIFVATRKR